MISSHFPLSSSAITHLQALGSPTDLVSAAVEDDKGRLEGDVTEDGEADVAVGLDAAVAGGAGDGGVVDVGAGDDDAGAADAEGEAGQGGAAGEDVAGLAVAVRRAADLGVVGVDDAVGEEEQRGARVGDAVDGARLEGARADGVAGRGPLPPAVGGRDGGVGDAAGVGGAVDVAEVVLARCLGGLVSGWGVIWGGCGVLLTSVVLEVSSEQRGGQRALGVVEEGLLLVGRDGVQAAEGQAEQAVVVRVLGELGGDNLGRLNGLLGDGQAANGDLVGVDVAAGGAAVAVRDLPGGARELAGGAALARVVDALARHFVAGSLAAEDPQIRGAGVEVEVQDLGRGANRDGSEVLRVVLGGSGRGAASGTLDGRAGGIADGRLELGADGDAVLDVGLGQSARAALDVLGVADLEHRGSAFGLGLNGNANARGDGRGSAGRREKRGNRDLREARHLD